MSRPSSPWIAVLSLLTLCLAATSCMQTRYVLQAGIGQAELWSLARPIEDVLEDPQTDQRTRVLLEESQVIMGYAKERGLSDKGNYKQYVDVDRSAVVWFLAAADPLALEPLVWSFPLVGSFPYLGWFDRREALQIRKRLKEAGKDVTVRPVHAYSTGGWLDDSILSTMLSREDDAFRYLSNILLHELTHANIFVNEQTVFNESIASFVGDTMAEEYLSWRFGAESEEVLLFREEQAEQELRALRFTKTYHRLKELYESDLSRAEKLEQKEQITKALMVELELGYQPNNAVLLGYKTYNTGGEEFEELYAHCGKDWGRFMKAVNSLEEKDFGEPQMDKIGPVILALRPKCQA